MYVSTNPIRFIEEEFTSGDVSVTPVQNQDATRKYSLAVGAIRQRCTEFRHFDKLSASLRSTTADRCAVQNSF